jgi:predicted ABC-type ATPase
MTGAAIARVGGAIKSGDRVLVVLAGPNGAGKTTFFELYLAKLGLPFVNADLLARSLRPEAPDTLAYDAARAADEVRRLLVQEGASFCTETVLSDPDGHKLALLREALAAGYEVVLVFIALESAELSSARVAQRVAAGGHDVPDDKVTARFPRTLANLAKALRFVDLTVVFDNSSADEPYRHLVTVEGGTVTSRTDPLPAWLEPLLPG